MQTCFRSKRRTSSPPEPYLATPISSLRINADSEICADYEAMSTDTVPAFEPKPEMQGARSLNMRDVILWQQEQAQRLGEVGLTTNFPDPADIFKPFIINTSSEPEPVAEDRAALVATNQETHRAIMQVRQRKILMDQAGPLLASTEANVDRRLLAAGVPKQDLPNKSLRQKIVQLVELKEPPPKANFVEVSVFVGSTTEEKSHVLDVNLPLKADVAEVHALLDEVVKALLLAKGLFYEQGGKWKYQLIDQNRSQVLMDKSLPLETDLDYGTMLKQVSAVDDGKAPMAMLTQVCHCQLFKPNCHL